jgi:AcrR family transcriptional regulator
VAAARELFADRGLDVTTDEIARRAGVGKATVYRGFATKRDLVDAVLEELVERFEALAEAATEAPDPLDGLCRFLVEGAQVHLDNTAFLEAAIDQLHQGWLSPPLRQRILAACARPTERARAAGCLGPDLDALDVATLIKMLAVSGLRPGDGPAAADHHRLDRYATLLLDGLRNR